MDISQARQNANDGVLIGVLYANATHARDAEESNDAEIDALWSLVAALADYAGIDLQVA